LIQQQPDITSIIWGAFRFLIGVRSYPWICLLEAWSLWLTCSEWNRSP
jgi:hypothetical protein